MSHTVPAAAPGLPGFTRRGLVAAAPAAVFAASLPALAAGIHPDAALLELRKPWLDAVAAFEAALVAKSRIDEQVFARGGNYPCHDSWTGSYKEFDEAFRKVAAERRALSEELGGDEADELEDVTAAANGAIVEQVETTPAHSLAGILFKIEVSEEENHGRPELIDSILADVKALATGGHNA